jgi:hypothetical protein
MIKAIENLVLWAMGTIAIVGLLCVIGAMVIGEMDYGQVKYIGLNGE